MDLRELEIRIHARLNDLERDLRAAQRMSDRAARDMQDKVDLSAKKIGASLTRNVTLPLAAAGAGFVALGTKAFQAAARMDTLERSMKAIMGSASGATRELEKLQQVALLPGISFEAAVEGSQRLQSVGLAAGKARDLLVQMANANALVGGSTENLQGALLQLSQTLGSGFLQGDELRIIAERIPVFRRALMTEFKTANSEVIGEMMKNGQLSMEAFIDGLISGLAKMPRAEAGIQTQIDKLKDMIFRAMAESGRELIPVVQDILPDLIAAMKELIPLGRDIAVIFRNMAPNIRAAIEALAGMVRWFTSLSPAMQQTLVKAAMFAAVLGPLVSAFAALRAAVMGTVAAYNVLIGQRAAVQAALLTMSTGATASATSFAAVGGAIRTLVAGSGALRLLVNPVTAVVAAVWALSEALDYVRRGGERYEAELKRQIAAIDEADIAASKNAETVRGLVIEYDALRVATKPTKDEADRMRDVLNQISKLSPELISGYDKQGNALGLLAGAYSRAADEAERLAKAAAVAAARPFAQQMQQLTELKNELSEAISGKGPHFEGADNLQYRMDLFKRVSKELGREIKTFDAKTFRTMFPQGKELDSIFADFDRKIGDLKSKMKDALNPQVAGTESGFTPFTPKGPGGSKPKITEAQRQAEALRDELYELQKAAALGVDATESMGMAYDLLMGKIDPVNRDLASQVIWQKMVVENMKEAGEATRLWDALMGDLDLQTKMLTASNHEQRAVIETQIGQYRDLTAEQKEYIVAKARERDEIEKGQAAQKADEDALRGRKEALTALVAGLEKEVALLDKKTRMAEFLYRLNAGEFAGASPDEIARAKELIGILDERDAAEERAQRSKKWFDDWLAGIKELAERSAEATKRFDDSMLDLRERLAETWPEADRLQFTLERLAESFGGGAIGKERAQQYMDELLDLQKAEAWKEQMVGFAKTVEEAFLDMVDTVLSDGFENLFTNVLQGFRKMLADIATEYLHSQLRAWLMGALGKAFGFEFRAAGGPVMAGRPYIVGENGPEMFVPNQGGQIVPNGRGAAAQTNVFNFHFPNVTNVDEVRRSRSQVALEYARSIGAVQRRTA